MTNKPTSPVPVLVHTSYHPLLCLSPSSHPLTDSKLEWYFDLWKTFFPFSLKNGKTSLPLPPCSRISSPSPSPELNGTLLPWRTHARHMQDTMACGPTERKNLREKPCLSKCSCWQSYNKGTRPLDTEWANMTQGCSTLSWAEVLLNAVALPIPLLYIKSCTLTNTDTSPVWSPVHSWDVCAFIFGGQIVQRIHWVY